MPTAEILSQGDEVVTGQIADTNAAWLAAKLTELGFDVQRHTSAGDRVEDLTSLFREAAARSDLVLCTGGLGPTTDDLTAQCVAAALLDELKLDLVALAHIEARYASFGRVMPAVNRKQAELPSRSLRLDNANGTAPGFAIEHEGCWLAFLPGVPFEMRAMFASGVLPLLQERFEIGTPRLITLRSFGMGESTLQERLDGLSTAPATQGWRASLPDVLCKLRFPSGTTAATIRTVVQAVHERLGSNIYAIEGISPIDCHAPHLCRTGSLAAVVAAQLTARGETLAVAESCTGGHIAAACTGLPGASAWFLEGVVTYSNASKSRQLGVPASVIAEHGAVSEAVVCQMAEGLRERSGATYTLATSGVAGPSGGTEAKPVGTVHLALATPSGTSHRLSRTAGSRSRVQQLAVAAALDQLRRHLDSLPLP